MTCRIACYAALVHAHRLLSRLKHTLPALFLALGALCSDMASKDAQAFLWPNVPDQIARALASGDVSERRLAAQRLSELPVETALVLIQKAMADPDVEVRLLIARAAVNFRMPKAGDLVVEWLSEGDARLRLAACDVIRAAPTDRSVVALGRVLGDPDPHVRLAAAAAMGASGLSDAVSPLLGHLDDPEPEVRAEVGRALGRIGDSRAVVPLIGKVQDSVPEVRSAVARALGELGDTRAVSALMLALQDTSHDVRIQAVTALGRLRSDEATLAISALVEASGEGGQDLSQMRFGRGSASDSRSTRDQVREAALRALGRIGSEAAVKALLAALDKDDPTELRSPVRDALASAGKTAVGPLVKALSQAPSANTAAGVALVLGQLKAKEGQEAITRGMQRGTISLRVGLRALAELGEPSALPTVLELLGDDDPSVRKEALRAANLLLDPAHEDGRAVDPARALLTDAATPIDEKVELVRILGRTGSVRAYDVLLPLSKTKSTMLRLAVFEALGMVGTAAPTVDKVLLEALDDESPEVRLRAAVSLSRVASSSTARLLLQRLTVAAEQDRGALGIALSGALARTKEVTLGREVEAAISSAPDIARDALIEGLGRMDGQDAYGALTRLASGAIDDRRKVAEALAGHPQKFETLYKLAADADPGVRANAVWSLGLVAKKDAFALLIPMLKDPDVAVAGNVAAALGRVAARLGEASTVTAPLCGVLKDPRPYVRANSLVALSITGASCEGSVVRDLVSRDLSEAVRLAAADYLARQADKGGPLEQANRRALTRCASEDKNATVALRCARPTALPSTVEDVTVFVVPDGRATPVARAPFALVRADGLMRLGIADRRGEVFEFAAPKGSIRLAVPAPLAK